MPVDILLEKHIATSVLTSEPGYRKASVSTWVHAWAIFYFLYLKYLSLTYHVFLFGSEGSFQFWQAFTVQEPLRLKEWVCLEKLICSVLKVVNW